MRRSIAVAVPLLAVLASNGAEAAAPGRSEFTMANGLRVRLAPAKDAKEVVVLLGVRAGFLAEPAGKPHVAHVAEHLVVFGGRPGSDEAKAVGRWFAQGRANGETHLAFLYLDLHVPPEELAMALRVQAMRLDRPTFTREALDREVPRALAEAEYLDRSDEGYTGKFAAMAFVQAALRGRAETPLRAASRGLTVDDVRAFWAASARPDRAILSVSGAFDPEAARKQVEAAFVAIPAPGAPSPDVPPTLRPGRIDATWDLRARHLLIAWPAPPPSDPDHPALTVASLILMQRLYSDPDINALARQPMVGNDADGCFLINVSIRPGADVDSLESKLLDRVARLSGPGAATAFEVAPIRGSAVQMLGFLDVDAVALPPGVTRSQVRTNVELQRLVRELSWGDPSSYRPRIEAVGPAAVRDAARRHLDPAKATIVRLGPAR